MSGVTRPPHCNYSLPELQSQIIPTPRELKRWRQADSLTQREMARLKQ
jgi:hypothetical protein